MLTRTKGGEAVPGHELLSGLHNQTLFLCTFDWHSWRNLSKVCDLAVSVLSMISWWHCSSYRGYRGRSPCLGECIYTEVLKDHRCVYMEKKMFIWREQDKQMWQNVSRCAPGRSFLNIFFFATVSSKRCHYLLFSVTFFMTWKQKK